ncbi:MAG: response regulator transcription factor [Ruminococcaceae bacterium]|nr:response regulator transcription factor [Oscillospiraceae bacterium]
MFKILVVEDNTELSNLFCKVLTREGYTPLEAQDGQEALDILDNEYVDLIITDIMMPRMDGIELVRELRDAKYTLPVLMITAKDTFADKQQSFNAGVDDYMVKPVDVNEMILRIKALLRRAKIVNERKLSFGETILEYDTLTLYTSKGSESLPQKEFMLLYKLASNPNHIFTRQQIMDDIWGMTSETDTHTVDVHINRIRDRLRDNEDIEIVTVRGLGYKAVKK